MMPELQTRFAGQDSKQQVAASKKTSDYAISRVCAFCNSEIPLDAGDVIFGEQWYHSLCWEAIKEKLG